MRDGSLPSTLDYSIATTVAVKGHIHTGIAPGQGRESGGIVIAPRSVSKNFREGHMRTLHKSLLTLMTLAILAGPLAAQQSSPAAGPSSSSSQSQTPGNPSAQSPGSSTDTQSQSATPAGRDTSTGGGTVNGN